jgi:TonB-linked SusC/RagA family outer membrane protein
MRSKFKWIFTLLVAFTMQFSFAQEKTVTGVVSDNSGPLPGANVVVKGTTRGVQTDLDGKYSIKAKVGETLVYSFIGLDDQSKAVGAANTISVKLVESATKLTEVVVEGYGKTTTKAKSMGATQTISSKTIEGRPNVNILQSLQGQLAGANIAMSSGQPGTNKIDVIIRGQATLGADTDPLYVIDGVPQTQAFFRNLNFNDVDTVSVLKDASATAIYGNRGTNGVIVITTKKGTYKSSLDVRFSSSYGLSEFRGDDYNKVNAQQHLSLQNQLGVGPGSGAAWPGQTIDPTNLQAYTVDTDWAKIFFRTGTTNSQDLSISSGSENLKNFTSIGYFQQEGIIKTSAFKRFSFRTNFSGKSTNDRFNYGANVALVFSQRNQLEQETRAGINSNVLQNPLNGYLLSSNYYDPNTYVSGQQLFDDFGSPALDLTPYMLLDLFQGRNAPSFFNETKTVVNGTLSYKLTKNITASTNTGVDYAEDKRTFAIGPEAYLSIVRAVGAGQPFHGLETQRSAREFMFNHVTKLNYNKVFADKHTVDFSLYSEYQKAHRRVMLFQQIGLNPLQWYPGAGTGYIPYNLTLPLAYAPTVGAGRTDAGLFSYFATAEYDYNGKYGFSGSFRRDASYKFTAENQWGTFWSVAGRWNVSKESFLQNSSWLTDLKLRISYGSTGNQNIQARDVDSDVSTIFGFSNGIRDLNSVQQGYGNATSFGVAVYGNPSAQWETNTQTNIGLDFNIKSRFSGAIDVYQRRTTDLFTAIPFSAANAFPGNSLSGNNGALDNKGVELSLRYDILKDTKFKATIWGNIARNESEIVDLGVLDNGSGRQRIGTDFINEIGGPIFQYFVVPYVGVNPDNGNLLFLDINGNTTEAPTDADRRTTGYNYLPIYQGGFGLDLSYEGFFANAAFVYTSDFYRFDIDYDGLMDARNVDPFPVSADLFNAWTPTNTNTDVPSLTNTNYDSGSISDRFLRNSSYIRLRNLSVGYNVPAKFLAKTFLKGVRFRVQGENLFTWTKWKGFDPESFETATTGNFPTPKLYTFGVDINF